MYLHYWIWQYLFLLFNTIFIRLFIIAYFILFHVLFVLFPNCLQSENVFEIKCVPSNDRIIEILVAVIQQNIQNENVPNHQTLIWHKAMQNRIFV